ncbi:MAG: response regulator transcription factor [Parabacteroides sp.]|nr:response regulator transcription factor [Parabacteroides sp.]
MKTPLRILFADDDLKYSLVLKRFLEREGYDVTYTGNGTMALEQYPVVKPDLVLLDINMPGLNGFEVAEMIRAQDKHVLIFFLSDRSDKSDRLKGFSLRGNDYLAKPFYPEELIARIKDRFEIGIPESVQEESYSFGNTVFNYTTNEIRTGNNKVLITSRQAELLRVLAMNLNLAVGRDLLLNTVWGSDSYANSLALNVQITYLRKALRNDPATAIISLPKKGYLLKG